MNDTEVARPGWREPMLWMVLALPALAVVGGIAMVLIALQRPDPLLAPDPGVTPALQARNHAATPAQPK